MSDDTPPVESNRAAEQGREDAEDHRADADRAYALWRERGTADHDARHDWFEAERQLRRVDGGSSARYWFVQHAGVPTA